MWNLLENEKPYKTNEKQQLRSPDRLSIPIIYLLIVFWASWKRHLGAILGRLSTILGRPGAILGRLGAILSSLDAVLGSSWPPKNLTRSLQDVSQNEVQHRSNIDPNLEAFAARKTWKTSIQERLKKPVSSNEREARWNEKRLRTCCLLLFPSLSVLSHLSLYRYSIASSRSAL